MTDRSTAYSFLAAHAGSESQSVKSVNACQNPEIAQLSSENIGENPRVSKVSKVSTRVESQTAISMALAALEYRQPDLISLEDWQQAVADGRRFIIQWGAQAETLGWTAEDLFGLHDPYESPEPPAASYRRLSRYDATGLIWLLHGRPVVALDPDSAAIGIAAAGRLTFYRHPQAKKATS